jgi:hypothetical protein
MSDKQAFFEQTLHQIYFMAGPNQSKKETVELPPTAPERPPDQNMKARETAPIQLPAPVAAAPESSGLKTETAVVSDIPDSPAVQMKMTQPVIAMPEVAAQNDLIALTPGKKNSMLLIWIVLGVSLLILIIQIWTYLS